ncbi:D-cysteine desulfhydrase [Candidatus Pseudothioglobus singularis]|nr:D-cysteine desulfhydrase [Candidatus Pseudothioglobus singularis]
MFNKFERIDLGHFPTRIEYLKNISEVLNGPQIFIKRDDCTGLATGGNKTRKLEFILPDAIKSNSDLIVTVGAIQSNHARQTAAACAKLGIKCLIVLEQRLDNAPKSYMNSGNVFLNKVFGAEMILCPKDRDVKEFAEEIMEDQKRDGHNPYFIPVGGSNRLGELGYIECMREILENPNKDSFSHIVVATGSGGTHAGLIAGKTLYKSNTKIIGISIKDNKSKQEKRVLKLTQNSCEHISCNPPSEEDVIVFDDYVGPGYAMPTDGMRDALSLMATKEAILLDPVYTGKAFDGLINLVRKNYFNSSDRVLFIHTGGSAALPAFEWAFS